MKITMNVQLNRIMTLILNGNPRNVNLTQTVNMGRRLTNMLTILSRRLNPSNLISTRTNPSKFRSLNTQQQSSSSITTNNLIFKSRLSHLLMRSQLRGPIRNLNRSNLRPLSLPTHARFQRMSTRTFRLIIVNTKNRMSRLPMNTLRSITTTSRPTIMRKLNRNRQAQLHRSHLIRVRRNYYTLERLCVISRIITSLNHSTPTTSSVQAILLEMDRPFLEALTSNHITNSDKDIQ